MSDLLLPDTSSWSAGWREALMPELHEDYFQQLARFLVAEHRQGTVYPASPDVFNALCLTPLEDVRVVILGQDPYHTPGMAHGLAFSVLDRGVQQGKLPPSLVNIFTEIANEYGERPASPQLDGWARQGVLLLNTTLTVRQGQAGSHAKKGWERFTGAAIKQLATRREGVVWLLWGGHAAKQTKYITGRQHMMTAAHPSPLSANRGGWFGNGHFKRANELLIKEGHEPIDWLATGP